MPGLGGPAAFARDLGHAQAAEKLAHQIAVQAEQLAKLCAGSSPVRRNYLNGLLGALEHMNYNLGVVDTVAQLCPEDHPADDAQVKVDTLAMVLNSPTFRQASIHKATPAGPKAPKSPIMGVLPEGAVVRDQKGRVTYSDDGSDDLAGGLGRWGGFKSITNAVQKVVSAPAKAIEKAQAKVKETAKSKNFKKIALGVATGGASLLTEKTLQAAKRAAHDKRLRNLALGIATGGASLLTKSTLDVARGAMSRGGGASAGGESVMTESSTTPPATPAEEMQSIVPGPGESSYDASADPTASPAENFGPEDMGPAMESEDVAADEQNMAVAAGGGGEGQSFTNTRDVDEGGDPFADGGSASDDAGEGSSPASADTYEAADDDDGTEDEGGGGDDSVETPPVEGVDGWSLFGKFKKLRKHRHHGHHHGHRRHGQPWATPLIPAPVVRLDGFPTSTGISIGVLAALGAGLYLINRKKK
jgi:hypothetical protein